MAGRTARLQQGFLTKEPVHGNALSQAKRRFFILTPEAIEWHEKDAVGSRAKGSMRLRGAQVSRRGHDSERLVVVMGDDELVLRLGAENHPGELDSWEVAIRTQVEKLGGYHSDSSNHRGRESPLTVGSVRVCRPHASCAQPLHDDGHTQQPLRCFGRGRAHGRRF
jgi:hypothetical protein